MGRRGLVVRTVLVPLVAIAAVLGVAVWAAGREPDTRSSLTISLDVLPAGTLVAGFTDWAAIRRDLGVGEGSTRVVRDALSTEASLRDLTTRSVLGGVIAPMHEAFGWSAADLEWETYGQSPSGAAMVARLADSVSVDEIERRLERLGYAHDGEVWTLDEDGRAALGTELAATLGSLAFVPRERLVVAADRFAYVPVVLATIRGRKASMLSTRPVADVASALAGSATTVITGGAFGCRATSVDELGPTVRAQAAAAVARAGDLRRPTFTGRGLAAADTTQTISFVWAFGSPAEAAGQLDVRSALAKGPFIGRSGRVEDVLQLDEAKTEASVSVLRFQIDSDKSAFMTGEGPLLFASCP